MNYFQKWVDRYKLKRNIRKIGQGRLKKLLAEQLPAHRPIFLDAKYRIPTYSTLVGAIQGSVIDEVRYRSQQFDCENFAFYFQSVLALYYGINTCGIVLSYKSGHAFNVLVAGREDRIKAYKYEPQEDSIWSPESEERQGYVIEDQPLII